jgi:hypothetical protein
LGQQVSAQAHPQAGVGQQAQGCWLLALLAGGLLRPQAPQAAAAQAGLLQRQVLVWVVLLGRCCLKKS